MGSMDRDMQKRVWERVQGGQACGMPEMKREELRRLLFPVQENGAAYQQLAKQLSGQAAEKIRRLHQESKQCLACIKGLCRLEGEQVKLMPLNPHKEPARRCLEKCYHREKRLWTEYESRSADPDHGIVFDQLAQQAREHCVTIAEVLGELEK